MQFMVGISRMTVTEKASLLAQIECFTSLKEVLGESGRQLVRKGKSLLERLSPSTDSGDDESPLDHSAIAKKVRRRTIGLASMNEETVDRLLKLALLDLAQVPANAPQSLIAEKIIQRAAKALRIPFSLFTESTTLEQKVFECCIEEQIEKLQKQLESLSDNEREELRNALRDEVERMAQADQEALRQAIGVETLSADALISFLKTTSGVAIAQLMVGSLGFGAFLFLTTFLKAFSALLGITFSFSTYMAATSLLCFILSVPFLLLMTTASGGIIAFLLNKKLGDEVTKLVVLAGRAKTLTR